MISILINLVFFPLCSVLLLNLLKPSSLNEFNLYSFILVIIFNYFVYKYFRFNIKLNINYFKNTHLLGVFIFSSIFFFLRISQEPFGMWDSWAMWNAKAKDFTLDFIEGNSYRFFRESWAHPGYPTFIPLQISFIAINIRYFSEYISYITNYFYLIFFFFMMIKNYSEYKRSNIYKLVTFFPFLLISLINQASDLCADFPLSIFFCFSIYLIINKEEFESEYKNAFFIILGIIIGILPLIKNEGIFILFSLLLIYFIHEGSKLKLRNFSNLFMGVIIPLFFFLYYKLNSPEFNPVQISFEHIKNVIFEIERYKLILLAFVFFHTIYLFFFIPLIFLYFFIKKYKLSYLYFTILILYILFNIIFLITPENQIWHIKTAYFRLNMQLVPAFFLITQHTIIHNINIKNKNS